MRRLIFLPLFTFAFSLTLPFIVRSFAKEKFRLLKKDGTEILADNYHQEGNFFIAFQGSTRIVVPLDSIASYSKVNVQPKSWKPAPKEKRVIFEKGETYQGTVAHFQLFCEKDQFPTDIFEKAKYNLEKILNETYYPLQQIAWKKTFTFEEAKTFSKTIADVLEKHGYEYKLQTFLTKGLIEKKLDCDLYSLIFFSVAENLHFPKGAITFIETSPFKGKALKVLKGKKYVDCPTKDLGHAYLRLYLAPGKYCILESTNGSIMEQPAFLGDTLREIDIAAMQKRMKQRLSENLVRKSQELVQKKDFEQAVKELEKALSLDSGNKLIKSDISKLKGFLAYQAKEIDKSIAYFKDAAENDPGATKQLAALYEVKAASLIEQKKFDEGIFYFEEAQKTFPDKERYKKNMIFALNRKGAHFLSTKEFNEAKECFLRVLNIDPNDESARKGLEAITGGG